MIKLIASDLDGTLLLPGGILPEETFGLIEELYRKGILFVPASGRQLPDLQKKFAPVIDKIAIIAENGGLCYFNGKIIYSNPTPAKDVNFALPAIAGVAGLHPLLSCTDCAYFVSRSETFFSRVAASYSAYERVESFDGVLKEKTVLKISVWDEITPCAEHGGKILPPMLRGLRTKVSGRDWLDVSVATANKGEALKALRRKLGIDRSECMGFGDHMNDSELLRACGKPYVTANAFEGLKIEFTDEVPSNAEKGVITKLKELL